jgi:hypothetical protein
MSDQEQRLSEHNVMAVFTGMEEARGAIQALEQHGLEARKISLVGPGPEEAKEETDTTDRDSGIAGDVGKRATVGAAAGGAVGGTAGFLAGAAAFSIPGVGPVIGAGIWAAALTGAGVGGVIGGVAGGLSGLDMGEAGELTYESLRARRVVVMVHADEEEEAAAAEKVLAGKGPQEVHRFDARGRPSTTG